MCELFTCMPLGLVRSLFAVNLVNARHMANIPSIMCIVYEQVRDNSFRLLLLVFLLHHKISYFLEIEQVGSASSLKQTSSALTFSKI